MVSSLILLQKITNLATSFNCRTLLMFMLSMPRVTLTLICNTRRENVISRVHYKMKSIYTENYDGEFNWISVGCMNSYQSFDVKYSFGVLLMFYAVFTLASQHRHKAVPCSDICYSI